jgi:hypothetical protein
MCIWQERKNIVRGFKGHVTKIAQDEHSSIVSSESVHVRSYFPWSAAVVVTYFNVGLFRDCTPVNYGL